MSESQIETVLAPTMEEAADSGEWIDCPHCQGRILISFRSRITSAKAPGGKDDAPMTVQGRNARWRANLDGKQTAILDNAISTGLLGSFIVALEKSSHNGMPQNVEKMFLDWLKLCKTRMIPSWALNEFKSLYPNQFVEFYGSGFVGAVVANGCIELFLPINLIRGTSVTLGMDGTKRMASAPDPSGLRVWIRTKMGYVPAGAKIALDEMRKRSFGEFARPSL